MSSELVKIAEGLSLLADGVRELAKQQNNTDAVTGKKSKKQSDAETAKKSEETVSSSAQPKESEQKISIEEIRAILADKSQDGKIKEVRALLKQFGVTKLSSVEVTDYPELLQKAKVL